MKAALTRLTNPPFAIFMVVGFIFSLAVFQLLDNWIEFFAVLYGKPDLGYHNLPPFIHYAQWAIRRIVWLILVVIFVLDFRERKFTRTAGYFTGVIFALVVSSMIFWVQWVEVMSEF